MMGLSLKIPKLTVVGAGCGDPDLITLKAIKALKAADVVLYDALANDILLEYAPQAESIFVGKRRGSKAFEQSEINAMIVEKALEKGHVVRLKGGDPFVFGRGMEEILFAQDHGLETDYVAGVTSAVAAVGSAGIAVTLRGIGRSFWTMTATTETGDLNPDLRLAPMTDATVVILMGISKMAQIVAQYARFEKLDTPVAVVQNGTLPNERVVTGTLATIESQIVAENVSNPAVIVIGDVVRERVFWKKWSATAAL